MNITEESNRLYTQLPWGGRWLFYIFLTSTVAPPLFAEEGKKEAANEKSFTEGEMVQSVLLASDFYQRHRSAVMSTQAWQTGTYQKRRELEVAAFIHHRDQDIRNKHTVEAQGL